MEAVPFWAVVLAICGGIVTIIGAIEKVVGAGKVLHAELEKRCDKYDSN